MHRFGKLVRIAFVDYVGDPAKPGATGLSDLVWDMASRLARLGDEVHVIAPYSVNTAPDPAVHVDLFPLPPIGYRNIVGHLLIVYAASRKLRSLGRFDVVHAPEYLTTAVLCTLLRDTPIVLTEPGNIFERVKNGNPYDPFTTAIFKLAARRSASHCARLVATSDEMAKWWQQTGFTPDRIVKLPLGIDSRLFRRVPDAKSLLGLGLDTPTIMYAARLSPENGADVMLRALAQMHDLGKRFHAHVLGDGPETCRLQELADALGISTLITWHGWVDFHLLPSYFSAADVFVFSGYSGGTPRVLLQAMACGAPSVASAIGGIVDHVTDGKTGLLFPAGSSSDLCAAVTQLLDEPEEAHRLGVAGCSYVHAVVDWDGIVQRLRSEVYAPLIDLEAAV